MPVIVLKTHRIGFIGSTFIQFWRCIPRVGSSFAHRKSISPGSGEREQVATRGKAGRQTVCFVVAVLRDALRRWSAIQWTHWKCFDFRVYNRPPSKIITFICSFGIRWFPIPNLVLRTTMMIKMVYGLEICVFVARSRGATSGLSLSAVFTLY